MKIEIETQNLLDSKLTFDEYSLLFLLFHNENSLIKQLYSYSKFQELLKSIPSKYFLSSVDVKLSELIISKQEVGKLIGERSDLINFWEFYNCYPVKFGGRIFRAINPESKFALKHQKKYLKIVKTEEKHRKAVASIQAFVAMQKKLGRFDYLPAMDTVLNNAMWEQWAEFIQKEGEEEQSWNTKHI